MTPQAFQLLGMRLYYIACSKERVLPTEGPPPTTLLLRVARCEVAQLSCTATAPSGAASHLRRVLRESGGAQVDGTETAAGSLNAFQGELRGIPGLNRQPRALPKVGATSPG